MHHRPTSFTRRRFLWGTGALAVNAALPNVLFAKTGGGARLVVVVLRGAPPELDTIACTNIRATAIRDQAAETSRGAREQRRRMRHVPGRRAPSHRDHERSRRE